MTETPAYKMPEVLNKKCSVCGEPTSWHYQCLYCGDDVCKEHSPHTDDPRVDNSYGWRACPTCFVVTKKYLREMWTACEEMEAAHELIEEEMLKACRDAKAKSTTT